MTFRLLAAVFSLMLAVGCRGAISGLRFQGVPGQIEHFNRTSYALVSSNYHLVKLPCAGCSKKGFGSRYGFGDEYLVLNFSTTTDAVILNGKQIHPQPTPPPDILAHQVSNYPDLKTLEFDLTYSNTHPDTAIFYPLSLLGYVVNVTTQAHPPGSSDTSLVTIDFRIIQVGSKVLDCLDSVEVTLLQTARDGTLAVKGTRFKQNEESYLPDTHEGRGGNYNGRSRYGAHRTDPAVTASGFRKCHYPGLGYVREDVRLECRPQRCRCGWSPKSIEIFGIVLAGIVGGVAIALLGVYFRVGLKKRALRTGLAIRCCSVGVWRRLRDRSDGVIRLPTDAKGDLGTGSEQE